MTLIHGQERGIVLLQADGLHDVIEFSGGKYP